MNVSHIIQFMLIVLLLAAGTGLIIYAVLAVFRRLTRRLRDAAGTIVDVEIDEFSEGHNHTVTLVYAYTVDGQEYQGRHIAFDLPGSVSEGEAENIRRMYEPGEPLTVYYTSNAPQRGQLERDWDDALFLAVVMVPTGLFLIIVAVNWALSVLETVQAV